MHRTFKREAITPLRHTCRQQQRNCDGFQQEYNTERPHEALGQETPASRYRVAHGHMSIACRPSSIPDTSS